MNSRRPRKRSLLSGGLAFPLLLLVSSSLCRADSRVCAGCHAEIWRKYSQSGMGRSFYRLQPANRVEDFTKNNHYFHAASETQYEMFERDGKYFQRRYQTGFDGKATNLDEKQIDFVMGSGAHARTYLHRLANGELVQLPLAWYSENGGYWAMNPGYDKPDHPDARRPIGYDCMFCHNAYPAIPTGQDRYGELPVYEGALPEGIDCQRCHGPGEAHIKAAQTAGGGAAVRKSILNPALLSGERRLELCMQCHLESTSFQLPHAVRRYDRGFFTYNPGEPLSAFMLFFDTADRGERDDRFQIVSSAYRLQKSACFIKSKGALGCTTCHDPHADQHGASAQNHYNGVCKQCHATLSAQHTAAPDCVACHMAQRRTDDVVHVVMTDHFIRRRQPARDLLAQIPERRETDSTRYHGEVVPEFPGTDNRLYVAIAQVRDRSNLSAGTPKLAGVLQLMKPQNAEPYLELAEAYKSVSQFTQAISWFEQSLRRDPKYLPALLELGAALKDAGQADRAAATLLRASQLAPSDARTWNALGQAYIDIGRKAQAASALERAAALDPEMPEPRNGLGILLAQNGDVDRAAAAFREAIRLQPNAADAHANLANLLSWANALPEAEFEFQQAIRLQPENAMAHFNYGSMLNGVRRFGEAQRQLEAAIAASANVAEAHDLLGNLLERQGRIDDALREYQKAVQLKPELSRAQLDLGATLAKKGDRQLARQHLRRAAQATDPTLRQMALQLLAELGG